MLIALAWFLYSWKESLTATLDASQKAKNTKSHPLDVLKPESYDNGVHPHQSLDDKQDVSVDSAPGSAIPEEWGPRLADILSNNPGGIEQRNEKLFNCATRSSIGVPAVQQECLRHLAFGLSDQSPEKFLEVLTCADIPLELRKEFLSTTLSTRPNPLTDYLLKNLVTNSSCGLSGDASAYLNAQTTQQPASTKLQPLVPHHD